VLFNAFGCLRCQTAQRQTGAAVKQRSVKQAQPSNSTSVPYFNRFRSSRYLLFPKFPFGGLSMYFFNIFVLLI
jgi:hypothetical protein